MILNILLLLFLDTSKTVSSKEILEYKNYDKPITNLKFNFEEIQEKINFSDSVFVLSKTTKTDSYCEITNEKKSLLNLIYSLDKTRNLGPYLWKDIDLISSKDKLYYLGQTNLSSNLKCHYVLSQYSDKNENQLIYKLYMFVLSNKQLVSLTQLALYSQDYYQIITDFSQKNSNNTFIITRKTTGLDIEDHQGNKTLHNCNFHVNDKGYIQIDE